MLVKTNNKEAAFRAVINVWLKDKTVYCNNCGEHFTGNARCCEDPQIGRNIDHAMGIIKQNKELTKTRKNDFASTQGKNMRWSVSIPPGLFYVLDNYKKSLNLPGLFREDDEINWFMRKFPQFRIPDTV